MKTILLIFILLVSAAAALGQSDVPSGDGIALSPARFELEMQPGTETTVVVNLDYRSLSGKAKATRIVASLNDWTITADGRVEYFRANTRPDSASSWLIYSPGEATVTPGVIHPIRVTIAVPADATPGDHLAALIVEQRPDSIKFNQSAREMVLRYRMASVFYIKVAKLTRQGSFHNLLAENTDKGIVLTPTLKNSGNSVIRPTASVKVLDAEGNIVADIPELEGLPVLAGAEMSQAILLENFLKPGNYTVKYRIDFQDGNKATEGITDLVVKPPVNIATSGSPAKKP
jgi:hypothetical protein